MAAAATVTLTVTACVTALALRSPWGAGLQAIRDNETAARTLGVPVGPLRLMPLHNSCVANVSPTPQI